MQFNDLVKRKNVVFTILILALLILLLLYFNFSQGDKNLRSNLQNVTEGISQTELQKEDVEVLAGDLSIPWEVTFLPNGEILVTERPGNLLLILDNKKIEINGVTHVGEGGLQGLALHPDFKNNNFVYLYFTTTVGRSLENRVERYRLNDNSLSEKEVIISDIPGAPNHDGGRIAFGPDGYLYITTGDAQNENTAQDKSSLSGKILRVRDDGSIPSDNPFNNAIYSYGHRNPQGLTWDASGQLWATEHGRSGLTSGLDEINKIEKGKNYGWPVIQGDEKRQGMAPPVINSGPNTTWAPAGAAFYNGSIFFGGLRGEALYEYKISENKLKVHFKNEYGRIRAVALGPDNFLYITTSNTDGRGTAQEGDDKLIKINPQALE